MSSERYTQKTYIGSGGMASVYRAYDTSLERFVAIKEIAEQFQDNEDVRQMFLREARRMAQVRHSNVVHVYDVHVENDIPTIVMELMEGGNLATRIAAGRMSVEELLPMLEQVVVGLKAIHDVGIVHRDVKPENILEHDGAYKIADFGLAMAGEEEILPFVTNRYAAPEVLLDPGSISSSSDLYSIGVMAAELLLGPDRFEAVVREAIEGDAELQIPGLKGSAQAFWQQWVASDATLPPLSDLDHAISPELSKLVTDLCHRDVSARLGDCGEVLTRLHHVREVEKRRLSAVTEYDPKLKKQHEKQAQKQQEAEVGEGRESPPRKPGKPLWLKLTAGVGALSVIAIVALFLAPTGPPRVYFEVVSEPSGALITINEQPLGEDDPTPTWFMASWGDTVTLEVAGREPVSLTLDEAMDGLTPTDDGMRLELIFAEPAPEPTENALVISTSQQAAELIAARLGNSASMVVEPENLLESNGIYSVQVGDALSFSVKSAQAGALAMIYLSADDAALLVYPGPGGQAPRLDGGRSMLVGRDLNLVATEPLGREWVLFLVGNSTLAPPDINNSQRIGDWARRYQFGSAQSPGHLFVEWLLALLESGEYSGVLVPTEVMIRVAGR